MAADVVAVVEALGCERVDLFGQSMGGMVAQAVAVRAPPRRTCRSFPTPATAPSHSTDGRWSPRCSTTSVAPSPRTTTRRRHHESVRRHVVQGPAARGGRPRAHRRGP
ncbi:alpha/beta fold hydrolase [Sanguibacter biliveldensis]|uniref:alpha/beta fold hydrolase n=1 Tax=Sanguibacter biliveldensis TaxID=3030830 RepID=UPI0038CD6E48